MEILSDTLFRGTVTIDEDQKLIFQTPSIHGDSTSAISQQSRGNSEVLVIESNGGVSVESYAQMTNGLKVVDNFVVVCDCSSFVFDYCSGGRLKLINDKSVAKIQMNGVDGSICAGSLCLTGDISANSVSVNKITAPSGASFMGNDFTCVGIVNRSQSNWSITHGSYTNTFPQKSGTLATTDDVYNNRIIIGNFKNPTIPSGCKKFAINQQTMTSVIGQLDPDKNKPYIVQVRKVSTNELMDMTVNIGTNRTEFIFERGSTDEIPANYFLTTVFGKE